MEYFLIDKNDSYDYNEFYAFPIGMSIVIDNNIDLSPIIELFYSFLYVILVFFGGSYLSMVIFINLTTNRWNTVNCKNLEKEEEEEEEEEEDIEYKNKYMELYHGLKENEINNDVLDSLKDIFVDNETPDGKIIMNYDNSLEGFTYYTDKKNIPYNYLETVARLYVIKHDCKYIYINSELELKKSKIINDEKIEKENDIKRENENCEEVNKIAKKKNVFAKLKSYKNEKTSNSNNKNENIIIPEKMNKYIYKGKLIDYELLINTKNNIDDDFERLDYSTFKKNQ
tara:strand:- start:1723 stop:2574 length:852 start_codon:yes stop_codon:yes gene_type:complete